MVVFPSLSHPHFCAEHQTYFMAINEKEKSDMFPGISKSLENLRAVCLLVHTARFMSARSPCEVICLPPLHVPHVLLWRCSSLYSAMLSWLANLLADDSSRVIYPCSPSSNVPSHMSTCCSQSKQYIGIWRSMWANTKTAQTELTHTTHTALNIE